MHAKPFLYLSAGLALMSAISFGAFAQDAVPPGSKLNAAGQAPGIQRSSMPHAMANMQGMHTMPATVTDADPKTGIVDVMAEGMSLRVHFPPSSMVNLKAGDKIGLYMAYSKANIVK